MTIIGCIVACQPKKKNGFKLTVIDNLGVPQTVHSFDDYSYHCDFKSVWQIEVSEHEVDNKGYSFHYYTITDTPRQIGSLDGSFKDRIPELINKNVRTDGIWQGIQRHQANPKNIQKLDHAHLWDKRKKIVSDLNSIHKGSCTTWLPTYQEGDYLTEKEEISRKSFIDDLKESEKSYGNRVNYYRHPLTNSLDDSAATLMLQKDQYNDLTVNTFPITGIKYFVDSIAAQIALREGHISEFFTYFAIIAFLKTTKTYPTSTVSKVLEYLQSYLSTYRNKRAKNLLMGCVRAGFIKIEGNPHTPKDLDNQCLQILSQQEYVRKNEAAFNARTRNAVKQYGLGISKVGIKPGVDAYIKYKELPTYQNRVLPIITNQELYKIHRPYFTYYAYRSALLDLGFSHLLNAHHSQMRAFLYELVVTSFDEHPICRTMISSNLGIPKSTQVLYEKANGYLEKRTNHTEIPEDMLNALSPEARDAIYASAYSGGKFKRSHSGKIYRQEGNSYRSHRIKWILTQRTARLKLSRRIIRMWQAVEPVFREGLPNPSLQEVPRELLVKEKLQATYVRKKKSLCGSLYFALAFSGVIIPTTNRRYWKQFEPHARYDKASGNKILPNQKSFWRIDENISRVERDIKTEATSLLISPVSDLKLSSCFT